MQKVARFSRQAAECGALANPMSLEEPCERFMAIAEACDALASESEGGAEA
jgi:hypothetical protein